MPAGDDSTDTGAPRDVNAAVTGVAASQHCVPLRSLTETGLLVSSEEGTVDAWHHEAQPCVREQETAGSCADHSDKSLEDPVYQAEEEEQGSVIAENWQENPLDQQVDIKVTESRIWQTDPCVEQEHAAEFCINQQTSLSPIIPLDIEMGQGGSVSQLEPRDNEYRSEQSDSLDQPGHEAVEVACEVHEAKTNTSEDSGRNDEELKFSERLQSTKSYQNDQTADHCPEANIPLNHIIDNSPDMIEDQDIPLTCAGEATPSCQEIEGIDCRSEGDQTFAFQGDIFVVSREEIGSTVESEDMGSQPALTSTSDTASDNATSTERGADQAGEVHTELPIVNQADTCHQTTDNTIPPESPRSEPRRRERQEIWPENWEPIVSSSKWGFASLAEDQTQGFVFWPLSQEKQGEIGEPSGDGKVDFWKECDQIESVHHTSDGTGAGSVLGASDQSEAAQNLCGDAESSGDGVQAKDTHTPQLADPVKTLSIASYESSSGPKDNETNILDLSEDESANRRYGLLYQELDAEREEVPCQVFSVEKILGMTKFDCKYQL